MATSSSSDEEVVTTPQTRQTFLVFNYPNLAEKIVLYKNELRARVAREDANERAFQEQWNIQPTVTDVCGYNAVTSISEALQFWAVNLSSDFCRKCNSIVSLKLRPTFLNKQKGYQRASCPCSVARYVVPKFNCIPEPLRNLSQDDIQILQPFHLDCGPYKRETHGYRVKTGMISLTISEHSVAEKIDCLDDASTQQKCLAAFNYLMSSEDSSYSHFVQLREQLISENSCLNPFDLEKTKGIECALWPNLYPYTEWCESTLCGQQSRLSGKISFMTKLFSEILDYGLHFDLLQFQYDRCMYKVVSGAINTGRFSHCSPARALDTKPFSPTYWQWQHRYVLDAVDQFGFPDVFVTISPYEWSFPFPKWLQDVRAKTGKGPTELAGFETHHIAHVLEEIVRGYLCGASDNRWTKHVFSYNRIAGRKNVKTYFYRFEFQQRGTVHLHLLVWLHDITKAEHHFLRADIPRDNPHLAYLVHKLQPSNKRSAFLNLQPNESFFENKDGKYVHHLKYPAEEFALNLRAYIATILPCLQCSMDYQTTDGLAMLLRYVTSYVTKWQDCTEIDSLYSYQLQGRQAAIRYLLNNTPAEPEMWLCMSSTKIAWSGSRTKRYVVPNSDNVSNDKIASKYWKRDRCHSHLNIVQWLRAVDQSKQIPKLYTHGNTLLGTKTVSIFNVEFFFQYTFLHLPHRDICEIFHPNHGRLPERLRWYAAAVHHFADLWTNEENLKQHLTLQSHRDTYITTFISYVQSLSDLFYLSQMQIINATQLDLLQPTETPDFMLDAQQLAIKHHITRSVLARQGYYEDRNRNYPADFSDSDSDSEDNLHAPCEPRVHALAIQVEWQKPILITGKPGSGKSHAILATISELIATDVKIIVASPTGLLSTDFRAKVSDEVTCDTVHAAFHIPVNIEERPMTNWSMSRFDLIVIDEISMIKEINFQHILRTLDRLLFRPVLVLCGDRAQQQPFLTTDKGIVSVPNALKNSHFVGSTFRFNLTEQHRVDDPDYLNFLDHIRHWVPQQSLLDQIQEGRVISNDNNITAEHILGVFQLHPDNTILSFTNKAANSINRMVITSLFANTEPIALVQLDCDGPLTPIYKDMRVTITQNRDKKRGVVNGQIAVIHTVHNCTIILKLPNSSLVSIYPVTILRNDTQITMYPFRLAYANTMCKAQGKTLSKAVLWFDIDQIPPGTAYVALSRVKRRDDIYFLAPLKTTFFTPVQ